MPWHGPLSHLFRKALSWSVSAMEKMHLHIFTLQDTLNDIDDVNTNVLAAPLDPDGSPSAVEAAASAPSAPSPQLPAGVHTPDLVAPSARGLLHNSSQQTQDSDPARSSRSSGWTGPP